MKKLIVGFLTAVCALCAAFGFTACNGNETEDTGWGKEYTVHTAYAKAVELGYDKSLDEFIATISGKDGTDGTDGKDGKDGKDGIDGADGVGIKDVKFDDDGNLTVILTDDSTKNLGKIPACEHSWTEWETQLEATCTSIGYSTRACESCGYTDYSFTEAVGHEWDDGKEYTQFIVKTCTVCKATQIEDKPKAEEPEIPAPDGSFILPVENAEITTRYEFVYDVTLDRYAVHQGLDFSCAEGTSVRAVLDGTITKIVTDNAVGENYVSITHANGVVTTYKYINAKSDLSEGDAVKQGDIIGTVAVAGAMEAKQGEHLHFEVAVNGKNVDPETYFNNED